MVKIALLVLVGMLVAPTIAAGRADVLPFTDPHKECKSCHGTAKPKGDAARFPADLNPSRLCLACHNYTVNHHPTEFAPTRPLNPKFPLFRGQITCLTCHQIHDTPHGKISRRLLRGAPYRDRRDVCFQCHTPEQYAEQNPHRMFNEHGGIKVVSGKRVCLLCHEPEPDPSVDEANTVLFRADVGFLCLRCHPFMHSEEMNKHFQRTPTKEVLANLDRVAADKKYTLPLVPRNRITCSTCHNPHEEGILLPGPAAAGSKALHRLRDDELCKGCHSM